jgi:glutamine amidotransferase
MTLGLSDGDRLYAVRYSTIGASRTLFSSADAATVRHLRPELEGVISDEARAIVSEPLGDLPGIWIEIPEATAIIVQDGPDEQVPFRPRYSTVSDSPGESVTTRVEGASAAT